MTNLIEVTTIFRFVCSVIIIMHYTIPCKKLGPNAHTIHSGGKRCIERTSIR